MQTNITLFCFLNQYSKNVAKILADKLDMFYVDFQELLEFDLVDAGHIIKTLGKRDGAKYINGIEQKTVTKVNEFENTVITISPQKLFSDKTPEAFRKSSFFVYLQMSQSAMNVQCEKSGDKVDSSLLGIGFSDRDKLYVAESAVVVNCSKLKEKKAAKKIIKELKAYFKKGIKTPSQPQQPEVPAEPTVSVEVAPQPAKPKSVAKKTTTSKAGTKTTQLAKKPTSKTTATAKKATTTTTKSKTGSTTTKKSSTGTVKKTTPKPKNAASK